MPLSAEQRQSLNTYLRSACADATCSGFLENFFLNLNSGDLATFLSTRLALADTNQVLSETFDRFSATRFNGIESACIDAAVNEIISRISRKWPEPPRTDSGS